MIKEKLIARKEKSLIVLGKPEEQKNYRIGNCQIVSHYNSLNMNKAMLESEIIISRSGYSTIMDLEKVHAKAIFIPTPGQTEQEYLAKYLKSKKICYYVSQNKFNLQESIKKSSEYTGFKHISKKTDWEQLFNFSSI